MTVKGGYFSRNKVIERARVESELISEGTFASLVALTEHERIPTKVELDRFMTGHGYHLIPEFKVLSDEEIEKQVKLGYEANEQDVDLAIDRRIAQAQVDEILRQMRDRPEGL